MNQSVYKYGQIKKTEVVSDPSQALYFTYGTYRCDATDGKTYVALPNKGEKATNNIYYLDDRKAICVFIDGHVESISPPMPDRIFN